MKTAETRRYATGAMSCHGCQARDVELAFLRKQVTELQDRLLATANPAAYQVYKGVPNAQAGEPAPADATTFRGPDGEEYLFIGGEQVAKAEYERMMSRLEDQMSGRASVMDRMPEPAILPT